MGAPPGFDMYARTWPHQAVVVVAAVPVILEPTPAQIARGSRVLYVESTPCGGASSLHKAALANGWTARLARARHLSVPSNAGEESRRGRALECETVSVRLYHEERALAGWAVWLYDCERAAWSPDGAQVARVTGGGVTGVRSIMLTKLERIVKGLPEELTEGEQAERLARRVDAAMRKALKLANASVNDVSSAL